MFDKGKVIERCVDDTQVSVRVQILDKDGFITKPIPVKQFGSRSNQGFWCPDIGDDVSVVFPPNSENGDGFVDGSFYNTGNPPPHAIDEYGKATEQPVHPDTTHKTFRDGSVVEFNPVKSVLTITTKGQVIIRASKIYITGIVDVTGNVNIKGNLYVDGRIDNTGDMSTGGTHSDSVGKHDA
jgi:phage baseplate assembly protein V